jgi:hypothetical protein
MIENSFYIQKHVGKACMIIFLLKIIIQPVAKCEYKTKH